MENSKEDITVWRFNLHTHEGVGRQMEVFDFCKANKIIGTGWKTNSRLFSTNDENITNDIYNLRIEQTDYDNKISFKRSMNALINMKKDDLIWTRRNNLYYLCKVTSIAKDFLEKDAKIKGIEENDIWHYVECEYIEIGTEEEVMPVIVRSFNQGVVCRIQTSKEIVALFSKQIYNLKTNSNYYNIKEIKKDINDVWNFLGALEIEEIIGLYMQTKLNYGIYTSSNKRDTKEYEYILFKRDNPEKLARLQVKISKIDFANYNISENVEYYFFSTQDYNKIDLEKAKNTENIKIITKKDIIDFIINDHNKKEKSVMKNNVKIVLGNLL